MIYDQLAMYYDDFLDEELYLSYLHLIAHYKKSGTVIDLGTGTAQLAIKLAKLGYFVTATDISEKMLENAYNNAVVEGVSIQFFIHDILEPLNKDYDIVLMSSDVINYLSEESQVLKAFKNISQVLENSSVFMFDFLKVDYLAQLDQYHESIELEDQMVEWNVKKTEISHQVMHTLEFENIVEQHLQTTFPPKVFRALLQEAGLRVVKKKMLEERIIFVCKKE
ncbi:MAG: class I SAM-dependent methyltransferase [Bacilli bacterium]|nr:class I SAM-dependent methyltransferase [Bacilli bacterium]